MIEQGVNAETIIFQSGHLMQRTFNLYLLGHIEFSLVLASRLKKR